MPSGHTGKSIWHFCHFLCNLFTFPFARTLFSTAYFPLSQIPRPNVQHREGKKCIGLQATVRLNPQRSMMNAKKMKCSTTYKMIKKRRKLWSAYQHYVFGCSVMWKQVAKTAHTQKAAAAEHFPWKALVFFFLRILTKVKSDACDMCFLVVHSFHSELNSYESCGSTQYALKVSSNVWQQASHTIIFCFRTNK